LNRLRRAAGVFVLGFAACEAALRGQDSRATAPERVILDDGSEVAGKIAAGDRAALDVGGSRVPKWRVREIEGAPERIAGEILVNRYLLEDDENKAEAIKKRILGLRTLGIDDLVAVLRDGTIRPPAEPGDKEITLEVKATKESFRVLVLVPPQYDPARAWPLWLTIHGTGGNAEQPYSAMAGFAREKGFLLASLDEIDARRPKGWGYLDAERIAHVALVRLMARDFHVDLDRVYVNGWSRGGHAAFDLAIRHPDLFAGAGPIIGSVLLRDQPLLVNAFGVRIDAVNGEQDQAELVSGAKEAAGVLTKLAYDFRSFMDPARGHDFFADRLSGMVEHLLGKTRDPAPRTVTFASHDKSSDRSFWVRIDTLSPDVYKPGHKLLIEGVSKMSDAERKKAYQKAIENLTAKVTATIEDGNRFTVESHLVRKLSIGLPPGSFDPAKKVTVTVNGQSVFSRKVEPSKALLLETARRNGDRRLAFVHVVSTAPK
jgi:pimeloyl-ACP methyl ester carboxylesterase